MEAKQEQYLKDARLISAQAEQALLGALISTGKLQFLPATFSPDHYAYPQHAEIHRAIAIASQDGAASPFAIVNAAMGISGVDPAYIAELGRAMVGPQSIRTQAIAITDLWRRREMVRISDGLRVEAESGARSEPGQLIAKAMSDLDALSHCTVLQQTMFDIGTAAQQAIEAGERAAAGAVPGISTGFSGLDSKLDYLEPGAMYVLAARPAMGKEQPIDTPTLTPSGWVPMGDLKPGDFVIGGNGKPVKVLMVHPQGVKQAYKVGFRDGTHVECGIEHLWQVMPSGGYHKRKDRTYVRSLRELIHGGICNPKSDGRKGAKWRVPITPFVCAERHLPVDPYILGVLLGDGSINGKDLRFSNPDCDRDIRKKVADRLESNLHLRENRSGSCPYFVFSGEGRKALGDALRDLGVRVTSSYKFIPETYKWGSIEQRTELLRGLMDTDGTCTNASSVFCTTAKALADDVAYLTRSLGGLAIVRVHNREKEGKPTEYFVNVKTPFCPFSTARKAANWRPQSPSRYIWSIEPTRMVEQVCITVDAEDGLYVTKDFIVTHNTALALDMALRIAGNGNPVLYASLEMGAKQLARRALALKARVQLHEIKRGNWTAEEACALVRAQKEMAELPFVIDQQGGITLELLALKARAAVRKYGKLGAIFVDHLGIMTPDAVAARNGGAWATEKISNGLKKLAVDMQVPLIALAQLNRGPESREDKRPAMSDLRQSGAIEQDAEAVMLLYREEYYLGDKPPEQKMGQGQSQHNDAVTAWHEAKARAAGKAEIIIPKVRDGCPGTVNMRFDGSRTAFEDELN